MADTSETPASWPQTVMSRAASAKASASSEGSYSHLNAQITDAVGYTNENVANYSGKEVSVPYEIMVSQSAGQVSQAAAQYMDGVMQVTLASQSVLMKKLVEDVVADKSNAAELDGLGIAGLELLMGFALAIGAGTGLVEGASAAGAIDLMDKKMNTYLENIRNSKSKNSQTSSAT